MVGLELLSISDVVDVLLQYTFEREWGYCKHHVVKGDIKIVINRLSTVPIQKREIKLG